VFGDTFYYGMSAFPMMLDDRMGNDRKRYPLSLQMGRERSIVLPVLGVKIHQVLMEGTFLWI
jgi:hypothetical protein